METDAHRLNQRRFAWRDVTRGDNLAPRQYGVLAHDTVALHAKRLVVLAGVDTSVAARGAVSAVGIGVYGYVHARFQCVGHAVANGFNHRSHFVTGDDGQLHHGVTAQVCVEVRPAEAHVGYLYHHFAGM